MSMNLVKALQAEAAWQRVIRRSVGDGTPLTRAAPLTRADFEDALRRIAQRIQEDSYLPGDMHQHDGYAPHRDALRSIARRIQDGGEEPAHEGSPAERAWRSYASGIEIPPDDPDASDLREAFTAGWGMGWHHKALQGRSQACADGYNAEEAR